VSIGEALAAARRQAGLTVTQVSQRTRIRDRIIRGIENDDYAGCGGDFYARGHIRNIAKAVGADPGPLIQEYDTTHLAPQESTAADVLPPVPHIRRHKRRLLQQAVVLAIVVALGFASYDFFSGSGHATSAASSGRAQSVAHGSSGRGRPHTAPASAGAANPYAGTAVPPRTPAPPRTTVPPRPAIPPRPAVPPRHARPAVPPRHAVPVRALIPVSATAIGADGRGHGDNPRLARLAIDRSPATAWHTDWYTTARFGNLYRGTGLLLNMGRAVAVTGAQITLGGVHGARFQLRVGAAPWPADLRTVARAANAGGVVRMRLTTRARGRYVLIWFTRLPRQRAGTFRASVHNIKLDGLP
jgi:cytoskeletal protein RodZ